ncbi:MAG: NADP-dependent glyceraldehyde-3-phosphate dehydrogenase [Spirochaetes bacterium]|nr:NADP-dependent glyceraldehyde-3-phosphate dehydrogenase [Spirochaetota bacterium]
MKDCDGIFVSEKDIPEKYRVPRLDQREYLLEGRMARWDGPVQEVRSPVCLREKGEIRQRVLGSYPLMTASESLAALEAACSAYDHGRGEWPTLPVEGRIRCMAGFTNRMREKRSEVVNLLMWEIGKNLADAEKEFDRTVEYIEKTVEALKDLDRASSRLTIEQGIIAQIRRAPLGVVLCMGPYNYPLNETFTTLIPALIMGNTVVFKPAKYGVLLLRPLLESFRDCFPPGVVNTIYGDGREIVTPIMETGRIDCLALIGSPGTAAAIEKNHPRPNRLRTIYGLAAKNPAVVLQDADLDLAVKECVLGSLSYNGQRCTALKIIFVHRKIADAFLERFSRAVSGLKAGLPWDDGAAVTPLPEEGKPEKMKAYVDDAVAGGAKVVNRSGGEVHHTLFTPAVLYPVTESMRLYREEQFGPVIPVVPFDDIETPLRYIVTSDVGQQASIFGRDPDMLSRLIDPLVNQVCRLNINSQCQRGPDLFPFTGRKDSAEGTLSISDALRAFSIRTLVACKENDLNREILQTILRERKSSFLNTDFIL